MYIKNKIASLIYKTALFILCGYGIYLNLWSAQSGFNVKALRYYTILSNMVCLLFYAAAILYCLLLIIYKSDTNPTPAWPSLKGTVVMCITVTFLIYQFLLAETPFSMNTSTVPLSNLLVHMIVPIMVILDWIIFDPKGHFKMTDPFVWLLPPCVYYIFILIGAQAGFTFGKTKVSRFPYPFIDSDKLGTAIVVRNVIVIAFAFLLLGYIFVAIDKLLGKKAKRLEKKSSQSTFASNYATYNKSGLPADALSAEKPLDEKTQ